MARIDNLDNFLTDIADALRVKLETQESISAEDYDTLINNIIKLKGETKTVKSTTTSQTVLPSTGKNGITEVTVEPIDLETKTVKSTTTSQTINPTSGKDGISQITVEAISLQNKTVTPTSSEQIITADSGYDGLGTVTVEAGSTSGLDWSILGYNTTPQGVVNEYNYAKNIQDNWDSSVTSLRNKFRYNQDISIMPLVDTSNTIDMSGMFEGCISLTSIPQLNTSSVTTMEAMFSDCVRLTTIPLLDTSNVTNMSSMFYSCTNLTTIPLLDTSNVTNFSHIFNGCPNLTSIPQFNTSKNTTMTYTFYSCTNLTTIPLLDTSNVSGNMGFYYTFYNCENLSNDSLNNILRMCINATSYTGDKTLYRIGLNSEQATTCQTLSNWADFVDAGWSSGY